MDIQTHGQLIYAHLIQAWATAHPGAIGVAEQRSLTENAMQAAKTFHENAMGPTTRA